MDYRISELFIYPVKSMAGVAVESVELGAGGFAGDRRWALRDLSSGKIASAKQTRPFASLLHWATAVTADGSVLVTSPTGRSWTCGDAELNAALSSEFGCDVEMVQVEAGRQETYGSYWPEIEDTVFSDVELDLPVALMSEPVSFVDLADLHVVTTESLDVLAQLMGVEHLPVRRFRPSMLLERVSGGGSPSGGSEAEDFIENLWTTGSVSSNTGVELTMMGPAPRCVMTTLDQPGIDRDLGVLQTIAKHNRQDLAGLGTFACLGSYLSIVTPGTLSTGDVLTVSSS